ncbi:MAG: hypothetical protein R3324_17310 [Halobacteriales archaeon]|nr:hypothetical protein [Halobacteriales archaeon]
MTNIVTPPDENPDDPVFLRALTRLGKIGVPFTVVIGFLVIAYTVVERTFDILLPEILKIGEAVDRIANAVERGASL